VACLLLNKEAMKKEQSEMKTHAKQWCTITHVHLVILPFMYIYAYLCMYVIVCGLVRHLLPPLLSPPLPPHEAAEEARGDCRKEDR
jgi:hypothetical protein